MEEQFIYHRVPADLKGTLLYPLNQLKDKYPEAYEIEVKKYSNRKELLGARIPVLDCLWNDVLHFTAVPPDELRAALISAGMKETIVWNDWFKIPVSLLDPSKTITCLYRRDIGLIPEARDFQSYDPSRIDEYRKIPPETIEYYKKKFETKERPLMFHRVPHILYKGTVNTKGLEIMQP